MRKIVKFSWYIIILLLKIISIYDSLTFSNDIINTVCTCMIFHADNPHCRGKWICYICWLWRLQPCWRDIVSVTNRHEIQDRIPGGLATVRVSGDSRQNCPRDSTLGVIISGIVTVTTMATCYANGPRSRHICGLITTLIVNRGDGSVFDLPLSLVFNCPPFWYLPTWIVQLSAVLPYGNTTAASATIWTLHLPSYFLPIVAFSSNLK